MVISSEIKNKLRGNENTGFIWLEEKLKNKKMRLNAKSSRTYYTGFKLNSLTIYEGDCVLINIGYNFGECNSNFEVARVLDCYHDESEKAKGLISVQWFTPVDKIRKYHLKSLPSGLPPLDGDLEVARDSWAYETSIDLETISGLCCVMEVTADVAPDTVQKPPNVIGRMYVCRFEYKKTAPFMAPLSQENIYKPDTGKSITTLGEITNNPKVGDIPMVDVKRHTPNIYFSPNHSSKANILSPLNSSSKKNSGHQSVLSEQKMKVKRKLLTPEDDQENILKKSKINTENKYPSSPLKGGKKLCDIVNKIEEVFESLEIFDLLGDEESSITLRTRTAKPKLSGTRKTSRRSSVIKSYAISDEDEDPRRRTPSRGKKVKQKNLASETDKDYEVLFLKRVSKATPKYKSYCTKNEDVSSPKGESKKECDNNKGRRRSLRTPLKETTLAKEEKILTPKSSVKKGKKSETKVKKLTSVKEDSEEDSDEVFEEIEPKKKEKGGKKKGKETPLKSSIRAKRNGTPFYKLPERKAPLNLFRTEFEHAREQLHVSAVPSFLPCREEEFHQIYSFVEGKLLDSTGGCMYVSGVPGTGKTATIREVVRLLQECQKEGTLPSFQFLEVNAMKLTKPHQLWVQIWEGLTEQRVTADHAYSLFEKSLSASSGPKRNSIFLLLDELDLLWTKKQDVMYNLFDLSSRVDSRLIVVTIANTMDLPERMMISRVSSRLGLTRMTFQPYTFKQLQEIIASRLTGIKAFDPDAIQLVARKVAAVSGDARRALDICRRATEIAEADKLKLISSPVKSPKKLNVLVGMSHVSQATDEMFSSPKIMAIRRCSQMDKYILQAVMMEFTRTGIEEAVLARVLEHLQSVCRLDGMSPPSSSQTMMLINGLSSQRILFTEHSRLDIMLRIRLNISTDDVSYALSL